MGKWEINGKEVKNPFVRAGLTLVLDTAAVVMFILMIVLVIVIFCIFKPLDYLLRLKGWQGFIESTPEGFTLDFDNAFKKAGQKEPT